MGQWGGLRSILTGCETEGSHCGELRKCRGQISALAIASRKNGDEARMSLSQLESEQIAKSQRGGSHDDQVEKGQDDSFLR